MTILLLMMFGCTTSTPGNIIFLPALHIQSAPPPIRAIYVLSNNTPGKTGPTSLTVLNPDTWQVLNQQAVLPHWASGLGRDPRGRIWVGLGQEVGYVDNRVQVFDPQGNLLATIEVCGDPYTGFGFTEQHALVGCSENGFFATLAVIDLDTFQVVERHKVGGDKDFLLAATAGDGETYLMLGIGGGARLKVFDAHTRQERITLDAEEVGSIKAMIPYQGRFYLLNFASYSFPEGPGDLGILDTTVDPPQLAWRTLPARSPLWGAIIGNQLYMYHDPTAFTFEQDPHRYMSRLDLETGETELWPLEDHWGAGSMIAWEGRLLLSGGSATQAPGLYEYHPDTGVMQPLTGLPGHYRHLLASETMEAASKQDVAPLTLPQPVSPFTLPQSH